ncbi:MAG: MFS transporter [Bacteroidales bacterium]|nr:MFS transporter [Bacteroidales bacterium]
MAEKVYKFINDNPAARWASLILIALMMFFGYMFVDVMSPLQSMIEVERGWSPSTFGTYAAGEYILNVCGFLILAGIILDKMGIRFTGTLSASLMLAGAIIKFIGISDWFQGTGMNEWLNSWWTAFPGSAKMAALGFMIFGCGCEMAGITVSRAIAKWFEGKEMALAMGLEMAIARVGVFAIFSISPILAEKMGNSLFGHATVVAPVAFCTCLLCIGLIFFLVFCVLDRKFDNQLAAAKAENADAESEEEFKVSDIGKIFSSKIFWVIALLCVLYYSAIFPFQRYGANMLQCNLDGISPQQASNIFRWFPIGAAAITPFLGAYLDNKGKGATMLIFGALLLIICHLVFAFALPATHSKLLAYVTIVILGISFALVPAALWPSVPKVMNPRYLGSAYSLIFWVQNVGLCFVPMLIGNVLQSSNANNQAVIEAKAQIDAGVENVFIPYDYTVPLIIFASFGVVAFLLALYLKSIDKKNNYHLEEPNIKK